MARLHALDRMAELAPAGLDRASYNYQQRPGHSLPRVRLWGAWNEPNIDRLITPQWEGGQPASPGIYRSLVNAGGPPGRNWFALSMAKGVTPDQCVNWGCLGKFGGVD